MALDKEIKSSPANSSSEIHSVDNDKANEKIVAEPLEAAAGEPVPVAVPPTQPDGGLRAWLCVLGCFFLWFNLWGYTFAFGTFQNYYELHYLPTTSPSSIAWIGSIQSFLLIISGLWSGPMFDWGWYMYMILVGAVLSTFGAFMLSLSTEYWSIFLSQGLCIGFGCGLLFIPSMALVAKSFVKNRGIAVGCTTCGAPIGGILYTVIFNAVIDRLGFAWTARVLGFFMLGTYIIAIPLLLFGTSRTGKPVSTGQRRKLFDMAALKDRPFWLYTASTFVTFMAYLVPYFYMPTYVQTVLGGTQSQASYALITAQGISVPGRLLAGLAANYLGVMPAWLSCAVVSGVVCLAWRGVSTYSGFLAFSAFYGAFSGPLVPLAPTIFPVVCPDLKVLGTRLGMAQSVSSIANLLGPPIAGVILNASNKDDRDFLGVQLYTGFLMFSGALFLVGLWNRLMKERGAKFMV